MSFWFINCLLVFLLCVFCSGIVIPQILLIAFRKQLFDTPDERKIHQGVVPRLGGIAFKPVVFFSFALLLGANLLLGYQELLQEIGSDVRTLSFGYCAVLLLYLSGMADDLIGIRYEAKFAIQILCGVMLIAGGIWINDFYGIFGIHRIPYWIGCPLTILLTVFVINAINLIDGIDGLASGLCSIACLSLGITFYLLGRYVYAMLAIATLGVLVPFFYYNVFGNPQKQKKIFMGDAGSLTIGMALCILSIKLVSCNPENTSAVNPMVLAFSPLLVPCCDVVRVYLHRVRNGRNPFLPDRNHIHHKLLAIGMPQRVAMIVIISVSTLYIVANILLSYYGVDINLILACDIVTWTLVNVGLTHRIMRK